MPFCYALASAPGTNLTTHATPGTENPNLAVRQVTRGVDLTLLQVIGRGVQLTTITGIAFFVRRFTTAGSGGGAITPAPRRVGTTATTVAADSSSALTPGTTSGAIQAVFGCGATGPGGWNAMNSDAGAHLEAGSSDEFDVNSVCGVASLPFNLGGEISE